MDADAKTATLQRTSGMRPASPEGESTLLAQPTMWVGSRLAGGRLHVIRQLGQGGMGTVYQAYDTERRCDVALKTLNRLDATSIYQLKNEFRSLCDVHHPNLVRLHELFCDHDVWFFTMDLLEGARFDHWVRPDGSLDEARLRFGLLQLVDALAAIHDAGKLHRDVKPSNVLVKADGLLQVLDFGLVVDPTTGSVGHTLSNTEISGTPDYMAPEQAMGQRTTAATDFYALGVMLFEALSGARPFAGNIWEVLSAKLYGKPPEPLSGDLPGDLTELCAALLSRYPEARPGAVQIRARVASARPPAVRSSMRPIASDEEGTALLGRAPELAQLREAYAQSRDGAAVVLSIAGDSGIGKSALCQAFLRELAQQQGQAVLLTGRCYEQENVPFKAVDPLIDELSRYLRRLRPEHAAALLPRDAFALAKLFPVLARVRAFEEAPPRNVPDPRELQRLAFVAFGELLSRIRDRSPLLIFIDDLQWTDADSAKLLRHCLVSREVIPLMFVFTHRLDSSEQPLLQSVIDMARENRSLIYRSLQLQPLTAADSELLAARWLGQTAANDNTSSAIAAESRGNPFFAM
ncbi:MAG TPA: protein kinase, partial [Polyangiales bacterium]|nr:protein kinase [Polyangiales bacterium]